MWSGFFLKMGTKMHPSANTPLPFGWVLNRNFKKRGPGRWGFMCGGFLCLPKNSTSAKWQAMLPSAMANSPSATGEAEFLRGNFRECKGDRADLPGGEGFHRLPAKSHHAHVLALSILTLLRPIGTSIRRSKKNTNESGKKRNPTCDWKN